MPQQGRDILADIVLARSFTEGVGVLVVMCQRTRSDKVEIVGRGGHKS